MTTVHSTHAPVSEADRDRQQALAVGSRHGHRRRSPSVRRECGTSAGRRSKVASQSPACRAGRSGARQMAAPLPPPAHHHSRSPGWTKITQQANDKGKVTFKHVTLKTLMFRRVAINLGCRYLREKKKQFLSLTLTLTLILEAFWRRGSVVRTSVCSWRTSLIYD